MNSDEALTLMRVAQGREPADLAVVNGRIVNVYTGEVHEGFALAAKGERIAYLGPQEAAPIGPATQVIDAQGQVVIPGLVESHTHLIARYSIEEFLRYAVPGGTTTIVTEVIEMGSVLGLTGIVAAMDAMAGQPIKVYFTVPPLEGLASFMEKVRPTAEEYRRLLARPDVVGSGEAYWGNVVLREDRDVLELFQAVREAGKVVEGHSSGARNQKLMAYGAAGATSCHEPINAQEVLERLRLGFYVLMREGWIRRDLEAMAPIWGQVADTRRLCLATDSAEPPYLLHHGYLERNLQKAIDLGLEPVKAIQMCTLNPATRFRLDHDLGGLAPGRYADLLLIPDLKTIKARLVVSSGRVVAADGRLLVEPRRPDYPPEVYRSVSLPRALAPGDFLPAAPDPPTAGRGIAPGAPTKSKISWGVVSVRAIEMVTELVTQEATVEVAVADGHLSLAPGGGATLVAAINRSTDVGQMFVGFARGLGMRQGGFATTTAWDCNLIMVAGADPADMALAVNRLRETQGGSALYVGGKLVAEWRAPVCGLVSQDPLPKIVAELEGLDRALQELGVPFRSPLLSIEALTTPAIPHLRLSERGYVRLRDMALLGLWEG